MVLKLPAIPFFSPNDAYCLRIYVSDEAYWPFFGPDEDKWPSFVPDEAYWPFFDPADGHLIDLRLGRIFLLFVLVLTLYILIFVLMLCLNREENKNKRIITLFFVPISDVHLVGSFYANIWQIFGHGKYMLKPS